LVAAKGTARLDELRRRLAAAAPEDVLTAARLAIEALIEHFDDLRTRSEAIEAEILAWHRTSNRLERVLN
jgi:hypothetical protein